MKKKLKSFAEKIKRGEKTVVYELLPPPKNLSRKDINRSFSLFAKILGKYPIDAINIPEVREESRNGVRSDTEIIKLEPRVVCSHLQKHTSVDFIINKPIVYHPWKKQQKWFDSVHKKHGVKNIVLVGGESSKINYPGLSVIEAAKRVGAEYPNVVLGGITIPTRKGEAKRVLQKSQNGVKFFTTQILYSSESIKKFLLEYSELCKKKEVKPNMIFLSFAPVGTPKDITLLEWLGVEIQKGTKELLTTGWLGMGWRSLQICQDILEDILSFTIKNKIRVPLGLNVEHLNRHNLESSFVLLERLYNIYGKQKYVKRKAGLYV